MCRPSGTWIVLLFLIPQDKGVSDKKGGSSVGAAPVHDMHILCRAFSAPIEEGRIGFLGFPRTFGPGSPQADMF